MGVEHLNCVIAHEPCCHSKSNKRQAWRKLSVNKCFLAKSPVGSLPFVHREFPIVGKFPCERGFYRARRQRRETLLAEVILGFTNLFCSAKQIREEVSPQIFSFGKSSRRVFYSFRPFGAPPSEREARKESAATLSKREAREGRAHKRGQGRRGKIAAAPRVIQVWFRAQASASRSSALTKASLPSQYASMS